LWPKSRRGAETYLPAGAPEPTQQTEEASPDWCAAAYEPIAGGGCFAAPPAHNNGGAPLIVYLHGRYARDAAASELDRQRRLAARAAARGFAVLALRGRLGTCTSAELADWFCWPSNEHNADAGPAFVAEWQESLSAAQERSRSRKRYLLGFSNGGYFAALIASRGLLDVDAVVVAHGGPVEPARPLHRALPLLLLSADDDIAQDEMIRFDDELTREHWAHDSYARDGGHGLTDEDIDAALTFFVRSRETLPLEPPLSLHRAVQHDRDASPLDGALASETQTTPEAATSPSVATDGEYGANEDGAQ
jgi:predicted esterase